MSEKAINSSPFRQVNMESSEHMFTKPCVLYKIIPVC